MKLNSICAQLAEARRLLGQMTAINIAAARIEQLAEIDGFCREEAKDVARHIESCDTWCAEYDKQRTTNQGEIK